LNGDIVENAQMQDDAVLYYLQKACDGIELEKITNRIENSIFITLKGKMNGSYGMKTYTTFEEMKDA